MPGLLPTCRGGTLDDLRTFELQLVAAVVDAPASYYDVDLRPPTALVLGSELGLDSRWREAADERVSIPSRGATVDSVNVSAAAAVLLFEAVRQRSAASSQAAV